MFIQNIVLLLFKYFQKLCAVKYILFQKLLEKFEKERKRAISPKFCTCFASEQKNKRDKSKC